MSDLLSIPVTASNIVEWIRRAGTTINAVLRMVRGLVQRPSRNVSGAYSVTNDDYLVAVDASGGNSTVTLPTPVSGRQFVIKRIDGTANTVTVSGPIEGATSANLPAQWDTLSLIAHDGAWLKL